MSYNGVGLSTARGSGTNGFVQRNLSSIKHKPIVKKDISHYTHAPQNQIKAANKDILDHEKKVKNVGICIAKECWNIRVFLYCHIVTIGWPSRVCPRAIISITSLM